MVVPELARAELGPDGSSGATGTIVLVEGDSDAAAIVTLAARYGMSRPGGPRLLPAPPQPILPRLPGVEARISPGSGRYCRE